MALNINKLLVFECFFVQQNELYHLKWYFSNKYIRVGQNVIKNYPFENYFLFLISRWFWLYQYCIRKLFVFSTVFALLWICSCERFQWHFMKSMYFKFKLEIISELNRKFAKKAWHLPGNLLKDYFTIAKIEDQICSWSCKALWPQFGKYFNQYLPYSEHLSNIVLHI